VFLGKRKPENNFCFAALLRLGEGNTLMSGTLLEKREQDFRAEHQRLLRALLDSIDKETTLYREVRRMKEALVEVALRLQVSYQVNEIEEATIMELRKEVSDARISAILAQKQFSEAADVILSLKREIGSLKRQLRDVRNTDLPDPNAPPRLDAPKPAASATLPAGEGVVQKDLGTSINLGGQSLFGIQADMEVDQMMATPLYKPTLGSGGKPLVSPADGVQTPFQEWKLQNYVYAPDTMQGSRNHDPLVVQLLNSAASSLRGGAVADRSTKAVLAKMRAPEGAEERAARELAESIAGLRLPALQRKALKAKEKGTVNVWALNPPEHQLSYPPKRLGSPIKPSSGSGSVVI
jgi:hypothetical protein